MLRFLEAYLVAISIVLILLVLTGDILCADQLALVLAHCVD